MQRSLGKSPPHEKQKTCSLPTSALPWPGRPPAAASWPSRWCGLLRGSWSAQQRSRLAAVRLVCMLLNAHCNSAYSHSQERQQPRLWSRGPADGRGFPAFLCSECQGGRLRGVEMDSGRVTALFRSPRRQRRGGRRVFKKAAERALARRARCFVHAWRRPLFPPSNRVAPVA